MMEILKKELAAKECAFATINYKPRDKNSSQFTSSALFNSSEKNLCIFCGGTHASLKCRKVSNPKARKDILFKKKFVLHVFRKDIFHQGALHNIVVQNVKDVYQYLFKRHYGPAISKLIKLFVFKSIKSFHSKCIRSCQSKFIYSCSSPFIHLFITNFIQPIQ